MVILNSLVGPRSPLLECAVAAAQARGTTSAAPLVAPLVAARIAAASDRSVSSPAIVRTLDAEAQHLSRPRLDPQSGRG